MKRMGETAEEIWERYKAQALAAKYEALIAWVLAREDVQKNTKHRIRKMLQSGPMITEGEKE